MLSEVRQVILQVAHDSIEESADNLRNSGGPGGGDTKADYAADLMGFMEWHDELHKWADEEDFGLHVMISLR